MELGHLIGQIEEDPMGAWDGGGMGWWFPEIGIPPNGWFIVENSMKKWMIGGTQSSSMLDFP